MSVIKTHGSQFPQQNEYSQQLNQPNLSVQKSAQEKAGRVYERASTQPEALPPVASVSSTTPLIDSNASRYASLPGDHVNSFYRGGPAYYLTQRPPETKGCTLPGHTLAPQQLSPHLTQEVTARTSSGMPRDQTPSLEIPLVDQNKSQSPEKIEAFSKQMLLKAMECHANNQLAEERDSLTMGLMNLDNPPPYRATDETNATLCIEKGKLLMNLGSTEGAISCFERGLSLTSVSEFNQVILRGNLELASLQKRAKK